jgi:uncharacterized glyoxalase superfamily protein PhnB
MRGRETLLRVFWGDRCAQLRDPFGYDWGLDEPAKG